MTVVTAGLRPDERAWPTAIQDDDANLLSALGGAKAMRNLMSREHETNPRSAGADLHLEEAEALIWAMLDDQLDDVEMRRLSKMIEEEAAVRARYIECVQLHVDLREHFGRAAAEKAPSIVVLANLLPGLPGAPGLPQIVE
ncbi:MAG: hypothetical protein H0T51_00195 [Pirellulales bacterium]|nr:hypothetical protein [Pirellulales bacterium]